ncbi:MAG: universal stress protein [Euryarchaeota archaeon]|nr:universal stress protein [Euryarchaeota archaeon]
MSTVLLPTDGSLPALVATARAVEIAKMRGATLVVLKVVEQIPRTALERASDSAALQRPEGEDGIEYARELAAMEGIPTTVLVREGAVVGEIIRATEETGADLIVMGTSSLKGLNRLYLGSVAKSVVAQSPTTVLVVKPTAEELRTARAQVREVITPTPAKAVAVITRTRQFRVGAYLFAIYTIGYAAFILSGSYLRGLFQASAFGLNVGLVAGILLIVITIALAVGFNWYAVRSERGA